MSENGYTVQTTFWEDFTIADLFGLSAIRDTYNRAFKEWNEDYKFLTELVLVLNHKIWQHHKSRPEVAALYNDLWKQADLYAVENLKDDYNPQIEMFARFKMKSSFHKTKRII